MQIYKAGDRYVTLHSKGNRVYSATGKTKEEAEHKVLEMIKKK